MARYQLPTPVQADIAAILKASEAQHGAAARSRYRALLTAAMCRAHPWTLPVVRLWIVSHSVV